MDVCNMFSAVVLGMTLNDIGLSSVAKGKRIPVLMFITTITALMFVLGSEIQFHGNLEPTSVSYVSIGVLMNIFDGITSIPYTYAMISRLVAILPPESHKRYLYAIMIVPLAYPIVDVYAILLLLGYPVDPDWSIRLFAIGNFAYGLTFFLIDAAVTAWLVNHSSSGSRLLCYFPFGAGAIYMSIAIFTAVYPGIDSSPIYLAYSIDILAYQQVSRNLTLSVMNKNAGSTARSLSNKNMHAPIRTARTNSAAPPEVKGTAGL
ncbi:hypothetical protein HDV01_002758 [Terramyces sp. JEL0728]|nr:hypothetical protein HDV01_002758 [Terramyces sp. JEL0728]